jgi:hypothetical protein
MKLSKENKTNRQKLAALEHPGALLMLVDFLRETEGDIVNYLSDDSYIPNQVAEIATRLKVQYLNNLPPTQNVEQLDLEKAIEEIRKDKPSWDKMDKKYRKQ